MAERSTRGSPSGQASTSKSQKLSSNEVSLEAQASFHHLAALLAHAPVCVALGAGLILDPRHRLGQGVLGRTIGQATGGKKASACFA